MMQPVATVSNLARSFDTLVRAIASGTLDPTSLTAAEERNLVVGFRAAEAKIVRKISDELERTAHRSARRHAERLRRGMAGRFLALWRTMPVSLRDGGKETLPSRDAVRVDRIRQILMLLEEVGDFTGRASATVFAKRKDSRTSHHQPATATLSPAATRRIIFQFGWIDKARQRLIAHSLSPFANYHSSQFLLRQSAWGRGRSGVCGYLRERVPALPGDTVFVQFDVRDFFGSISSTWIERHFRLPVNMIRRHIHSEEMILRVDGRARAYLQGGENSERVRRVLPQGSALASLIAEMAMAEVLGGLTDRLSAFVTVTYSDNLGIFLPGGEAAAIEDHLRETFGSSDVGPFEITASRPMRITEGFRFLGHHWRMGGDDLQVTIPEAVAASRALVLGEQIMSARHRERLRTVRGRIMAQANEWKFWPGVVEWRSDLLALYDAATIALERASLNQQHAA